MRNRIIALEEKLDDALEFESWKTINQREEEKSSGKRMKRNAAALGGLTLGGVAVVAHDPKTSVHEARNLINRARKKPYAPALGKAKGAALLATATGGTLAGGLYAAGEAKHRHAQKEINKRRKHNYARAKERGAEELKRAFEKKYGLVKGEYDLLSARDRRKLVEG